MSAETQPKSPRVGPVGKGAGVLAAIALAIGATLNLEGGYVNDPVDPGGETNHGVTIGTARDFGFEGAMIDLKRDCDYSIEVPAEIAELLDEETLEEISGDEDGAEPCAAQIYFEEYIERPGYVPLFLIDDAVASEVFDTAINMGPRRPSRFFQRAINSNCGTRLAVDGRIGPLTTEAWMHCRYRLGPRVCVAMLDDLDRQQRAEYLRLIRRNPALARFRNGWLNHRIGNVDRERCQ